MSTAIIVSGSVRNMINAANSWKFKGDYHLTIDRTSYFPQTHNILADNVQDLKSILDNSPIRFTSVNVCLNNKLNNMLCDHPNINMAWKWKCAYYNLVPYHSVQNYSKILLLRPDLWVKPHEDFLTDFVVKDNIIYTTSTLYSDKNDPAALRATDLFFLITMDTFKRLSFFYDFYIKNWKQGDIHLLLATFIIENNIEVNADLRNLFDMVVLRHSSNHMFDNGLLKEEYSFSDIVNSTDEWWNERFK